MQTAVSLGIFGGTFDPVHIGHLRGAEEVAELLGIERVLFVPTGFARHKDLASLASPEDRLTMLELAVASNPRFGVLRYEIEHPEHASYTYYTLRHLHETVLSSGQKPFLILGEDAFAGFPKWHRFQEMLEMCHIAVMARPPIGLPSIPAALKGLESQAVSSEVLHVRLQSGNDLYECRITPLDISSSRVRERLLAGRSVRYLVPEEAFRFIQERGLYRKPTEKPKQKETEWGFKRTP